MTKMLLKENVLKLMFEGFFFYFHNNFCCCYYYYVSYVTIRYLSNINNNKNKIAVDTCNVQNVWMLWCFPSNSWAFSCFENPSSVVSLEALLCPLPFETSLLATLSFPLFLSPPPKLALAMQIFIVIF